MKITATVKTRVNGREQLVHATRIRPNLIEGDSPWGPWRCWIPLNGSKIYEYPCARNENGRLVEVGQNAIRRAVSKLTK